MLIKEQFTDIRTGRKLAGFFIRNRQGKIIATGADNNFVQMRHIRYANDNDMVQRIAHLTGLTPRR